MLGLSTSAESSPFKLLYAFPGNVNDPLYTPVDALVQDASGNLYGVTQFGSQQAGSCIPPGQVGCGDVYKLTPPAPGKHAWHFQELYSFTGPAAGDGEYPFGALIFDKQGDLYGTTYVGGSSKCDGGQYPDAKGCGIVYELTPTSGGWTEKILYKFTGRSDGAHPIAGLVFDAAGNLYGTTTGVGTNPSGTVFELSPPSGNGSWKLTTLNKFCLDGDRTCSGGSDPEGTLIFDGAGNLYGTTLGGGTEGVNAVDGTVFELSPQAKGWKETDLCTFNYVGGPVPAYPASALLFVDGTLYGTSEGGGTNNAGTVFSVVPAGKSSVCTTLHNFDSTDGAGPVTPSGLVFDGTRYLYGTTSLGGVPNGSSTGVVFRLDYQKGTYKDLHDFTGGPRNGTSPEDGVIFDNLSGGLIGTTEAGGGGDGTVYELSP